jgi:hypothetical protein
MLTAIAAKYMIGGQGILLGRAVTSFIAFPPQTWRCKVVQRAALIPGQIAHYRKTSSALAQ